MDPSADRASVPTLAQLRAASALAILGATIILVAVVLPAEYGSDPTGFGSAIGLTRASVAGGASSVRARPVQRKPSPFRTDQISVTLGPRRGAEIKASMREGDGFMFSWTTDGPVDVDMHGDRFNAKKDEFTSFWTDIGATSGHGSFQAPFSGRHGWFWKNIGDVPVTVTLRTSGYYEEIGRP